jgi:2,4-diketo-3-deoxy-L-fuconate hydrolase
MEVPGKIICAGLNYRAHADESPFEAPAAPLLFGKWTSSLVGPGEPIVLPDPSITTEVDYEAELGVVIGSAGRDIDPADAFSHVRGYLCFNDVSARDVQHSDGQWTRAKSFDTFGPIGPLVPAAAVPDPQNLPIRLLLNGEVMQEATTAQMIFGIAELIAFASRATTLEPGDLIATGTPGGIGARRTPPRFLRDGDEVTVEIDGVGSISNPVVAP